MLAGLVQVDNDRKVLCVCLGSNDLTCLYWRVLYFSDKQHTPGNLFLFMQGGLLKPNRESLNTHAFLCCFRRCCPCPLTSLYSSLISFYLIWSRGPGSPNFSLQLSLAVWKLTFASFFCWRFVCSLFFLGLYWLPYWTLFVPACGSTELVTSLAFITLTWPYMSWPTDS